MVTKEIIKYVKKEIAKHKSKDEISRGLISAEWQQEDINEIFLTIENQNFKRPNIIKIIAIIQIIYGFICISFIFIDPSNPFFRSGVYEDISTMTAFVTLFAINKKHYKIAKNILVVLFSLRAMALIYLAYIILTL